MAERDNFKQNIKETLAKRAGCRCSNPACKKLTVGPKEGCNGVVSIGIAAHITAASSGGPRYCPSLTPEERGSIENGIWLCASCASMIDHDVHAYTVEVLKNWKQTAEESARREVTERQLSNDATYTRIYVEKWICHPEPDEISWYDVMFLQTGGIMKKGYRWIHYISRIKEWERPYVEAMREEIIRKNIRCKGSEMQNGPNGIPVFNNEKIGLFTFRAWGDLMAATWAEKEDKNYSYIDFYG